MVTSVQPPDLLLPHYVVVSTALNTLSLHCPSGAPSAFTVGDLDGHSAPGFP